MPDDKNESKLTYFANTIHDMVETKKREARQQTNMRLSKMAAEALAHASRHHQMSLAATRDEEKRRANRHIAKAKVRAMSAYAQTRHQEIDRLFTDIEAKLAAFTLEASYEAHLIEHIQYSQTVSQFSIVRLSPQDMHLKGAIQNATGLTPEAGEADYIGGFMLLNAARSIQMDCTFKTRLNAAKKGFDYDGES